MTSYSKLSRVDGGENETKPLNPLLKKMGATSWNDAAICVLVYSLLLAIIFSILVVVVTFFGSFFSGLKP